jgi:hypothetical protein
MLTSAAADEAALESRDIGGSFFTNHLVSGLRGAADASGDGMVTLTEAYQYAYAHTIAASSATLAGPQHPAYDYELSGQGELVLTELDRPTAILAMPAGFDRLLVVDLARDQVIAELATDARPRLAVQPGRYAVRAWRGGKGFAGDVAVAAGQTHQVTWTELSAMTGTPRAKGDAPEGAHGPAPSLAARTAAVTQEIVQGGAMVVKQARPVFDRARRAISFGPALGGGLVVAPRPSDADGELSFGLGLHIYEQQIFDLDGFTEELQSWAEEKLKQKLEELGPKAATLTTADLKRVRDETYAEARRELVTALANGFLPHVDAMPDPIFAAGLEGGYQPQSGAWQIRAGLGIGLGPVTLGPTAVVHLGEHDGVALGPELGLNMLVGDGPRPLGLELFLRYDAFLYHRDVLPDQATLGVRVMLDVF